MVSQLAAGYLPSVTLPQHVAMDRCGYVLPRAKAQPGSSSAHREEPQGRGFAEARVINRRAIKVPWRHLPKPSFTLTPEELPPEGARCYHVVVQSQWATNCTRKPLWLCDDCTRCGCRVHMKVCSVCRRRVCSACCASHRAAHSNFWWVFHKGQYVRER